MRPEAKMTILYLDGRRRFRETILNKRWGDAFEKSEPEPGSMPARRRPRLKALEPWGFLGPYYSIRVKIREARNRRTRRIMDGALEQLRLATEALSNAVKSIFK